MSKSPSIAELSSSVQDNGRRGMPKAGCDCIQCFGYCNVDRDESLRAMWGKRDAAQTAGGNPKELDFRD